MHVSRLTLHDFRSYDSVEIDLSVEQGGKDLTVSAAGTVTDFPALNSSD